MTPTTPATTPTPFVLTPPGIREVVDEQRAEEIVGIWKTKIAAYRTKLPPNVPFVCEKISLSDKSYTSGAAALIAEFIKSEEGLLAGIKIADLSDIIASRMEEEGLDVLKKICDAFIGAKLEEVDLSDNAMGCKGISACASVLSKQSSSLKRLSLCNNGLSSASMSEVADILCNETNGDSICSRLTKIHFFNNMSGDGGGHDFARIIEKCTSNLTDIRFSGTRAGKEGSLAVSRKLLSIKDKLSNVVRLDLADNTFSDESGKNIAKMIRYCPKLTYLNLCDCMLADDATSFICHSLWGCDAAIEHLDLSGNEITRKGCRDIVELLGELGNFIRVLRLEENELKSHGVSCLAKVLGTRIEEIKLGSNFCGRIGANALLMAFADKETHPNLRLIDLNGNGFPEEDVAALEECFGDKLPEMDDNDEDDDADEDLTDVSDDEEEAENYEAQAGGRKGDFTQQLSKQFGSLAVEPVK